MSELVALDLPGGPDFVAALQRVWDEGNAALPVDQHLPDAARERLVGDMRVGSVVSASGTHRFENGQSMEPGDALVVVTSGSTGDPKGVVLTHDAIEASARASSRALGVRSDDHWLACLPMAHIGGLSVVTRSLLTGTALTVVPAFDAAEVTALARECTLVSLVATALQRIDPSLFRLILLGGSRPPDVVPPNVVTTYGSTETGSGIVYDGRPLDGVEIRIADDGEILVRGPMLMRAYRDGTTAIDADGWLHTDDEGSWLPDGRLHVTGRRGDVIVTGGRKVWPEAVERVVSDIIGAGDQCIVGLDDPEWGQTVVLATTRRDIDFDRLCSRMRDVLPSYSTPRRLHVLDEIPRTSLGKIRRNDLRRLLARAR